MYHEVDAAAAINAIVLRADYWRTDARGKTMARNYRESLETYFRLDSADGRRVYDYGVKQGVEVAGEVLNVYIDALVYRGSEHTARIALWDVPLPSDADAAVMASPIVEALEKAVGEDRAHKVAFWHLRSGTVLEVDRRRAKAGAAKAADAVRRAAGH